MEMTMLVVDDDDAVRRILRKVLEAKAYRVLETWLPQQACQMFDGDPAAVNLLVTDVKMPLMSGQQVAAHMWATRPNMPVLFISGYTDQAYAQELHGLRS